MFSIQPISPASSLHKRALAWAARLGHSKAYDGHYLALAEEMRCDLLTADARLARSAQALRCHSNALGRVSSDASVGIPAAEDSTGEVPGATVGRFGLTAAGGERRHKQREYERRSQD